MALEPSRSLRVNIRRKRVADLYLQGWTQTAIAADIGVTQPTVSLDLKKIQEAWRKDSIRDFDLRREIELQKIDRVEREAWSAWERSQKPDQSVYTSDDPSNRARLFERRIPMPSWRGLSRRCRSSPRTTSSSSARSISITSCGSTSSTATPSARIRGWGMRRSSDKRRRKRAAALRLFGAYVSAGCDRATSALRRNNVRRPAIRAWRA
jgi:predicted transcriptional regulator